MDNNTLTLIAQTMGVLLMIVLIIFTAWLAFDKDVEADQNL